MPWRAVSTDTHYQMVKALRIKERMLSPKCDIFINPAHGSGNTTEKRNKEDLKDLGTCKISREHLKKLNNDLKFFLRISCMQYNLTIYIQSTSPYNVYKIHSHVLILPSFLSNCSLNSCLSPQIHAAPIPHLRRCCPVTTRQGTKKQYFWSVQLQIRCLYHNPSAKTRGQF